MLFEFVPKAEELLLEQIPPEQELGHTFAKSFDHRMKLLIAMEKSNFLVRGLINKTRRIAIVIFLISLVTFTTIVSVEALRTKFFKVIIEIYQELTSFSFQHDEQPGDITVEPAEPEYIPEGFKKASTEDYFTDIHIIYRNEEGKEIIFKQIYITNDKIIIDTEGTTMEKLWVRGCEAYYISNKGTNRLMWFEAEYL
ncbi:MAG TPA: hypothetical protein DHV55_16455, partial [Clostridiaceae bacterium]|nr:hypothetical protein [Clostridiaceae bacterium]